MLFQAGHNYFFFNASPDNPCRPDYRHDPFYSVSLSTTEAADPLIAGGSGLIVGHPFVLPRFLYHLSWNRRDYAPRAMSGMEEGERANFYQWDRPANRIAPVDGRFPADQVVLAGGGASGAGSGEKPAPPPLLADGSVGLPARLQAAACLILPGSPIVQLGARSRVGRLELEFFSRRQMSYAAYLSLRDIINPELSREEIYGQIDRLYFQPSEKNYLFRLLKILFETEPDFELELVGRLYRDEPEFARFLTSGIFQMDILPLIHGFFLQGVLREVGDEIIAAGWAGLSPPVKECLRRSMSRNRFGHIQKLLATNPAPDPEKPSLRGIVEKSIFSKFARSIPYERDQYRLFREASPEGGRPTESLETRPADFLNLRMTAPFIQTLALTDHFVYLQVLKPLRVLRCDILVQLNRLDSHLFHKMNRGLILRLPWYSGARLTSLGAIGNDGEFYEAILLARPY